MKLDELNDLEDELDEEDERIFEAYRYLASGVFILFVLAEMRRAKLHVSGRKIYS